MSIDLLLGFRQRPHDLEPFLFERGFQLKPDCEVGEGNDATVYRLFIENLSAREVHVVYYDRAPSGESVWHKVAPEANVVATASVTTFMGRNAFDEQLQRQTARDIRNRYYALLYDPQAGRFVHNRTKLPNGGEYVSYPVDFPGWYASQWDSRSVAIFCGSNPQPVRIVERPEGWGDHWSWNLCDEGIYFKHTK